MRGRRCPRPYPARVVVGQLEMETQAEVPAHRCRTGPVPTTPLAPGQGHWTTEPPAGTPRTHQQEESMLNEALGTAGREVLLLVKPQTRGTKAEAERLVARLPGPTGPQRKRRGPAHLQHVREVVGDALQQAAVGPPPGGLAGRHVEVALADQSPRLLQNRARVDVVTERPVNRGLLPAEAERGGQGAAPSAGQLCLGRPAAGSF